jgi:GT2 family glycosyltransferase
MAVRREAFSSVQGFRIEYSKVDNSPKSEDTDFCMRVAERSGGGVWMFVPEAIAEHEIGLARSRFKFFVLRCFAEGKAKVELAHLDGGRRELLDESAYMRHAAPASAGRYARMALIHRDSASLRRGAAIIAGLIAATLGAIVGEAFNLTHGSSVRTA